MSPETRKESIRERMTKVRERTLHLLDHVPDEFLNRRVHRFYSPIGWHFGHVGRTEECWVCGEALGLPPLDPALDFLYTDRPDNPKDARVAVPGREATLAYLAATRERVLAALDAADVADPSPLLRDGYAWEFALQHECQHQETICEMLQLIGLQQPAQPFSPIPWVSDLGSEMVNFAGGTFLMGCDDPIAYDNEREPHEVTVAPFRLARTPVTAFEWSRFIDNGGYTRRELWSDDGWVWRNSEGATKPEYWIATNDGWGYVGPCGSRAIHPDEPVSSVSWHEAEAYARWAGRRLPSEDEWEFAAGSSRYPWGDDAPTSRHARHAMESWGPAPVGSHAPSASGLFDVAGNVWEWTSSLFRPYPGFVAYPYDGYSKDHMNGPHRVCRGGSWATAGPILRRTFRNWYVPGYRQGFLGLRLADDA